MLEIKSNNDSLVSTEWLFENLNATNLKVVDVSQHLPITNRVALNEYLKEHILGAIFLNQADLADPNSPLPNTVPQPEHFSKIVSGHGISSTDSIILYDADGIGAAPRAWWLFKYFGHKNVFVLDGGLCKWKLEQKPIESGIHSTQTKATFKISKPLVTKASYEDVRGINIASLNNINNANQIVDARSAKRFSGEDPEPDKGISSGHMPGSLNLPWTLLVNKIDGTMLPGESIKEVLSKQGIDINKPILASCGSGVTACVILFALHLIGKKDVSLYDGSWSEWARLNPNEIISVNRG
jgi:thiosulfate/3-mercaptopyruvate sulfurtransferase